MTDEDRQRQVNNFILEQQRQRVAKKANKR